jgi:hypothetical protein
MSDQTKQTFIETFFFTKKCKQTLNLILVKPEGPPFLTFKPLDYVLPRLWIADLLQYAPELDREKLLECHYNTTKQLFQFL